MFPLGKRASDLNVSKSMRRFVQIVFCQPANVQRTEAIEQYHPGTGLNASGTLLHPDILPGGNQPIECPRSLVPVKSFRCRNREQSLTFKGLHRWFLGYFLKERATGSIF
jgi:hypothetical protein